MKWKYYCWYWYSIFVIKQCLRGHLNIHQSCWVTRNFPLNRVQSEWAFLCCHVTHSPEASLQKYELWVPEIYSISENVHGILYLHCTNLSFMEVSQGFYGNTLFYKICSTSGFSSKNTSILNKKKNPKQTNTPTLLPQTNPKHKPQEFLWGLTKARIKDSQKSKSF